MNEPQTQSDDTPRPSPLRAPRPIRFILGLHERLVINGVRYKELSHDSLRRALSRRGTGFKEYAVRFPQGRRMRIKVTPWRWYEDLTGPVTLGFFERAGPLIRPGSRLLTLRAGTGFAATYLADCVGPSGAVVCLDDDEESIRYARWRYPRANVAYEDTRSRPPHRDLSGETDGSFDAALLVNTIRQADDAAELLAECMRVVAPGGWVYLVAPLPHDILDPLGPAPMTRDDMQALVSRAHAKLGENTSPCFIRWLDDVKGPAGQGPDLPFPLGPHSAALIRLGEASDEPL